MLNRIYTYMINTILKKRIQGTGMIILDRQDVLALDKSAVLRLNGHLILNANRMGKYNGRSTILRMDKDSSILTKGNFSFMYGSDIILFPGAKLELGKDSYINSDCKIRCHHKIVIGDNCSISHDFTIMDSDAHKLNGVLKTRPVSIGNHVWIGTRVTILSGVKVGNGAVVAAGSLVKDDIPEGSLVAGVPAQIIKENVSWG